ncbi:hypothetical protein OQA88_9415 [Cercophora sp. LCS_1]
MPQRAFQHTKPHCGSAAPLVSQQHEDQEAMSAGHSFSQAAPTSAAATGTSGLYMASEDDLFMRDPMTFTNEQLMNNPLARELLLDHYSVTRILDTIFPPPVLSEADDPLNFDDLSSAGAFSLPGHDDSANMANNVPLTNDGVADSKPKDNEPFDVSNNTPASEIS